MTEFIDPLWAILMRNTIAAGLIGTLACVLLRIFQVQSATTVRVVCCAVLVQGWIVWQINVPLPETIHGAVPVPLRRSFAVLSTNETAVGQFPAVEFNGEPLVFTPPVPAPDFVESGGITSERTRCQPLVVGVVIVWVAGAACLLLWTLAGYVTLWHRIRDLDPVEPRWDAEWQAVLSRLKIRGPVRMLQSPRSGPLLYRMPRETVLVVPRDRWPALSASQREAVLLHEAVHLRRADLWKSLAIRVLALPQWFNPLSWWAVRRFDDAAEWACDDEVDSLLSHRSTDYARALVRLSTKSHFPHLVLSAAGGRSLTARVRRLLSPPIKEEPRMKSYVLCTMIALLSGLSALRPQAVADLQDAAATSATAVIADNQDPDPDLPSADDGVTEPASAVLADETAASPLREAFVDMNFLFKNDPVFREQQEQLKAEVAAGEHEMQDIVQEMRTITVQLQSLDREDERAAREALESAIAELRATMDARNRSLRQRLIRAESELYFATYQRISAAIAEHARENGIQIVRRSRTVAEFNGNDDTSSTETDGLEMSFPNRQAIMQMINRDIVYMQDGPLDITHAVLERLTRSPDSSEDHATY